MKEKMKSIVKGAVGWDSIKSAGKIIFMPLEFLDQRKKSGDDPKFLKKMSFEELMNHWKIPVEKVDVLIRHIKIEKYLWIMLALFGSIYPLSIVITQDFIWYGFVMGSFLALIGILNALLRNHYINILTKKRYITFKDYIMRRG